MKLGLICDDNFKSEISEIASSKGITFYDNPDLFIVQSGREGPYLPCIVFDTKDGKQVLSIIETLSHTAQTNKIIGYDDETMHITDLKDILYFEAKEACVYFVTEKEALKIKEKLYEIEHKIMHAGFIRISRSVIINIDKVSTIAPWFNRRLLITFEGVDLTVEVSKKYVSDFKRFLGMG
ncbi:LytTR family DNA-binding domain-containing protein [Fusibacter sp. JL216-2]|uniref:LytTR family DNA-binding domain-containing protein n=1 Tax=Fusibacter sp. JL216-2 TaxID=3071453 RepID=UPI003D349C38